MRAGMDDPHRIEAARRLLDAGAGRGDRSTGRAERAVARRLLRAGRRSSPTSGVADAAAPRRPPPTRSPPARSPARRPCPSHGAYLGAPIEVDGARVGVLCVYDDEPFEWTPHDLDVLRELAIAIAAELERGALVAELETSTVRLDLGFAAANIGSFDWDLRTNELHWDERLMELFGYDAADVRPAHRQLQRPPAPRRPRARRRPRSPARSSAAASTRPTTASCTTTAPCAGSRRAGGCCAARTASRRGCSAPPTTRPRSTAPPSASGGCSRR